MTSQFKTAESLSAHEIAKNISLSLVIWITFQQKYNCNNPKYYEYSFVIKSQRVTWFTSSKIIE